VREISVRRALIVGVLTLGLLGAAPLADATQPATDPSSSVPAGPGGNGGGIPTQSAIAAPRRIDADLVPRSQKDPLQGATELPDLRTADSRTFQTPDGNRIAQLFPAPVNYRDANNAWQPIDNTLVSGSNQSVHNKANAFSATLPYRIGRDAVTVDADGHSVSFTLLGADGVATTDGTSVRYDNAMPHVNVAYDVLNDRLRETLSLSDPTAPTTYVFALKLSNDLTTTPNDRGGIDLTANGSPALTISPPTVVDAAGNHGDSSTGAVRMMLGRNGDQQMVTLDVDPSWLHDPRRVFPVTVDPDVTLPGPNADCYLDQALPTTTFCSDPLLKVSTAGGVQQRVLLRFDNLTTVVPNTSSVLGAEVTLHTTSPVTTWGFIDMNPLSATFDNNATWNKRTSTSNWTTAGGDFTSERLGTFATSDINGYASWDPTEWVRSWVERTRTNYGLIVRQYNSAGAATFASWNNTNQALWPTLLVRYAPRGGLRDYHSYEQRTLTDKSQFSVNVANGNAVFASQDVNIRGTGLNLTIDHYYNSLADPPDATHRSLGTARWGFGGLSNGPRLFPAFNGMTFVGPSGYAVAFVRRWPDGVGWISPSGVNATLTRPDASTTQRVTFNQTGEMWNFTSIGSAGYRVRDHVDRNGNTITYSYPTSTSVFASSITDTQGRVVSITYNGSGYVQSLTDSTGRTWQYGYTGGNLTSYTDPENKLTSYGYDGAGNLNRITDANGHATKATYDSTRRVSSFTQVTNYVNDTGPTTTFSYTASPPSGCTAGLVTAVTDPNVHVTTYCFDYLGRVTKVVDALGHSRASTYTSNSDVQTFNGNTVSALFQLTYDTNNNLTQIQSPASVAGQTAATSYVSYAAPGQAFLPSSQTDPQARCAAFAYDTAGNLTHTYTGLTPTSNKCDGQTGAKHTSMSYNANGTLATVTEPMQQASANPTRYGYDAQGNLRTVTPPTGSGLGVTTIVPDALSRISSVTDGRGKITTYTYDKDDRVTRVTYNNDTVCASRQTCTDWSYDNAGNLTTRVDSTGTTTFNYDALNHPTRKTLPASAGVCAGDTGMTMTYDPAGNLSTFCDNGGTLTYTYNNANQLTGLAEPGGTCTGTPTLCTTFGYDNDGRRTTTTYPTSPQVTMTTVYDPSGKVLSVNSVRAGAPATTLANDSYTYNVGTADTGLMQIHNDSVRSMTGSFVYDTLNRLTQAQQNVPAQGGLFTWLYTYDDNGNRLTSKENSNPVETSTYNSGDVLTAITSQTVAPTTDTAGNMTRSPYNQAYTYNDKGQTASATPNGGATINMAYADADQTERVSAATSTYTTTFISGLVGITSETTGANTQYFSRDNRGVLHSIKDHGSRYYYLLDGDGSVVGLVNSVGTVVDSYHYDPFGRTFSLSQSIFQPFRYRSGYFSDILKVEKFGTRYYDPRLGRWTQQEPLAGSIQSPSRLNGYVYAQDDPANRSDVSGRFDLPSLDCITSSFELGLDYVGILEGLTFAGLGFASLDPAAAALGGTYAYINYLAATYDYGQTQSSC
jgi:RHS repeat-associated protein